MESFAVWLAVFVEVAQVGKVKCYAGVEKCEVAQTVCQDLVVVFGNGEYRGVGLEGYRCAGVVAGAYHTQFGCGLAAAVLLHVCLAVAVYFGAQISRECVYTTYAYTVQTTGHLVGAFIELTTGMQHCQNHLKSALALFFVEVDRNTAAVVDYGYGVVGVYCYVDFFGKSGEGFVD